MFAEEKLRSGNLPTWEAYLDIFKQLCPKSKVPFQDRVKNVLVVITFLLEALGFVYSLSIGLLVAALMNMYKQMCVFFSDEGDIICFEAHGNIESPDTIEIGGLLGRGGFYNVYRAVKLPSREDVAVKISNSQESPDREEEGKMEAKIMQAIHHPNIATLSSVLEHENRRLLIMKLYLGGDLHSRLLAGEVYNDTSAVAIMRQLLGALDAMHKCNFVHLDVKPENILFESKAVGSPVILIDFNLSRELTDGCVPFEPNEKRHGTLGYMSPELLSSDEPVGPPSDVFGAGAVLYNLLVGAHAFASDSREETKERTRNASHSIETEGLAQCSPQARDLLRKMLATRPEARITVEEALAHPWMNSF